MTGQPLPVTPHFRQRYTSPASLDLNLITTTTGFLWKVEKNKAKNEVWEAPFSRNATVSCEPYDKNRGSVLVS